jgi:ubiquinone/menaquinone biosynthesis C-methylase UbiE
LDAGGGTGYWAIRLAKHSYKVVLTDISENMLKVASEKIRMEKLEDKIEIKNVDIREMSCFPSNSFDMAIAEGDPVSYCLNAEKAVKELARVVKENAHLVVSVDSKYTTISRILIPYMIQENFSEQAFNKLSQFLKTGILKRDFEFQAFTPEELKALFETCGLKVIRIIGKPILTQLIPTEKRDETIKNDFTKMLRLELKFCDASSLVGIGGHLEIVGIKHQIRRSG